MRNYLEWSLKQNEDSKKINVSIKIRIQPIRSSKMAILSLLWPLKAIKTDRKSIVVSGSLYITSRSRLKWPFVPKQGPRCLILDWILVKSIWHDRALIVDSDGLDLTSVSLPGWSFMPEQGPRSKILDPWSTIHDPWSSFFEWVLSGQKYFPLYLGGMGGIYMDTVLN